MKGTINPMGKLTRKRGMARGEKKNRQEKMLLLKVTRKMPIKTIKNIILC